MDLLSRRRGLLMKLKRFMRKVLGVPPITLTSATGDDVFDCKIYGNSVQDGTPTPDTPIEIESVGERTNNLFDIDKGLNNCFTIDSKGTYTITKTDTGRFSASIPINLKAGVTYIISYELIDTNSTYMYPIQFSWHDGITGIHTGLNYRVFTPTTDITSISIYQEGQMSVGTYTTFKNLQIEEGNVATEYEPFGYKIPVKASNDTEEITTNIYLDEPLRKIEDYADYIDFENKEVVRKIAEYKFNGNDKYNNVEWNTTGLLPSGLMIYGLVMNQFYTGTSMASMGIGLCSHFPLTNKNVNYAESKTPIFCIRYATWRCLQFAVDPELYPDLDTWKAYVKELYDAGTPLTVAGVLNDGYVTHEAIDLPELPTLNGTTVYTIDTKTQPSNMEITYYSEESE